MKALTSQQIREQFGYDEVGPFREGLAWVRKGDQWFHIRPDGQPAYEQRYDWVCHFSGGRAKAKKGGQQFYIRTNGTRVEE